MLLTPTSIKFNRFVKLILVDHMPLLACFGFMTSQKWLVSVKINLRKRLNLIDVGVKICGRDNSIFGGYTARRSISEPLLVP